MVKFELINNEQLWNSEIIKKANFNPYQIYSWGQYKKKISYLQEFKSQMDAVTQSKVQSEGEGRFTGESQNQTFEPIREFLPGKEYSLQEQIYKSMVLMINQPIQSAVVKIPLKPSVFLYTPFISDISDKEVSDKDIAYSKLAVFKRCPFIQLIVDVKTEIKERKKNFKEKINESIEEAITVPEINELDDAPGDTPNDVPEWD